MSRAVHAVYASVRDTMYFNPVISVCSARFFYWRNELEVGVWGSRHAIIIAFSRTIFVNSNSNIRFKFEFVSQSVSYLLRVYNVHANTFEYYQYNTLFTVV